MNLFFANPAAGAWALLGIPAVLAIHFLQTPSRPRLVSTLFLLERLEPKSASGRRLERLRQSLPLWLQLLAVLIVAWLLAQPRWLRKDSSQTVLVLLDSSASMRAFQKPLQEIVPARLRSLASAAAQTEWLLLETDPAAERLYSGGNLQELEAVLKKWKPNLGEHDFQPALRSALSLVNRRGTVLFVSDHEIPVPAGVELLAIGHPLENLGFSGARVTETNWEALVTNFGSNSRRASWHMETPEGAKIGEDRPIELPPGGTETLRAGFPKSTGSTGSTMGALRLVLSPDEFTLDNTLPLVRPEPKQVRVEVAGADRIGPWLDPFFRSEKALERTKSAPAGQSSSQTPHLRMEPVNFGQPLPGDPKQASLLFLKEPVPTSALVKGICVTEKDPLMDGLSWEGLVLSGTSRLERGPADTVLLWMDDRPLILRRNRQLVFGFDVALSNAPRMPAFVLFLHRFVDLVRAEIKAPEAANFETNQLLEPSQRANTGLSRTPSEPGFFEAGDPTAKLRGAAHFADPRESDFKQAASVDHIEALAKQRKEGHAEQDAFIPIWILLLGVLMVWNWLATDRKGNA
jgi:hypothetical protein